MSTEQPTVLIVEDEEDLADLYASYLASIATIRRANSGDQARAEMSTEVDVVLLDRRLPDMMGEELIPEFRHQNPDVGIAMVTAVHPDFDILDMGFDDYLTKPADRHELKELVQTLAARSQYGSTVRDYFSLLSKRAALLTEYAEDDLQDHPDYQTLETKISERKADVDALLENFSEEDFIAQFRHPRSNHTTESPESDHIRSGLPINDTDA